MFQLLYRPAESADAFSSFATAATLADARDELASPIDLAPHHGDLVRVVGDGVDDLHVFDAARSSFIEVPRPRGATPWFERWDGNDVDAANMLLACDAVDRRRIVLAACDCAETALQHVPAGEERPRIAIETARRWVRGEASPEDVRMAADASWAATYAAFARAASTATATYAASTATATAFDAASAAATAIADYATWQSTRVSSLRSMAPLVRRHIPLSVLACSIVSAADPLRIETG